jgi:arabinose-5-phosphate isomerase
MMSFMTVIIQSQEILKRLLDKEQMYLNHFFENLDYQALEEVLNMLAETEGIVILCGIGKSGLVAEKMSVTLTSTGSRSIYLSPMNALHGDIGIVTEKDIFLMISKSGESDELLNLIPFLRNKGVKIVSIIAEPKSRLAKASDYSLIIPLEKELCPFDLAPTTSTVIQMIICDILAIALMELKNFTKDQFVMNHPAGRIGRRLITKVKDLMIVGQGIPLCSPEDRLNDTLVELSNKRCGCVLVVDEEQRLMGIFTDGDLRRTLQTLRASALEAKMETIMMRTPRSIGSNELAWTALQQMEEDQKRPITVLPVLDQSKKVVGIIKMHDIIQSGL